MTLTLRVQRCAGVALLCGLCSPVAARAQDPPSQIEIGGQAGVSGLGYGNHPTPGLGGWLDVNVSRHVALETRVTLSADSGWDRTLHLAGGLRATFLRTPRFGWYGLALPGLYEFPRFCETEVTVGSGPNPPVPSSVTRCAARTNFALDLGSGLAVAPTSHFVARIELNRVIHSSPHENLSGSHQLVSRWDVNAGVSYRLGRALKPPSAIAAAGRWTVGSQIGDTLSTGPTGIATLGAFASYTLSKYCDIDTSASAFLSDQLQTTVQEGGRLLQGLAGVKMGVREGRFGVFFKARTGANSYSRVLTGVSETYTPIYSRSTVPALDLGAVVETYLSGGTLLRIDMGETLSFVPDVSIPFPRSSHAYRLPARAIYGLPLRVGFGWRF